MSVEGLFDVVSEFSKMPDEAELFKFFLNDDDDLTSFDGKVPRASPQESPKEDVFDTPESSYLFDSLAMSVKDDTDITSLTADGCAIAANHKKRKPAKLAAPLLDLSVSSVSPPALTEEDRLMKRQKRLIKNRESAQLSRLRKKLYMEDLERKVCTLTSENEALQKKVQTLSDELLYLRSTLKSGLVPSMGNPAKKPLLFNQKNSGAAGICLLLVLFSFGLIFNSRDTSSALSLQQHRDPVPDVLPPSQRVLSSIKEEPEVSRELVNVFPRLDADASESADRKKRIHDHSSHSLVGAGYKPNDDDWQTKRIKIEVDDDERENKGLVPIKITPSHDETKALSTEVKMANDESRLARKPPTSYIFCSEPQEIVVSANASSNPNQPPTMSLLLPSGVLNGTIFNENNESDGLVEISCQVLNIHVWHITPEPART